MSGSAQAADRHARVAALFRAALDQPEPERMVWLDAQEVEADLRAEVRALLAEHAATTPAFFDTPLVHRPAGASDFNDAEDPLVGRTIRGWTLTGRLGRGGMGTVYRARRADDTFEQHAALKLVRPGFEHDFGARFLRERALLASLDHPGIARLLDGGVTEDGTPYLAMDLVEGTPITTYAEAHGLSVAARVRLFLQVCEAVAYAHRSLVVHRDLKPSHMLVAEDSGDAAGTPSVQVKLLDFGIAKLMEGAPLLDAEDALLTRTGAGPMTPSYAAPEQFLGQPITTATDVYALGVVLFELLAGQRPYDLATLTASQVERVVSQERPPRPSDVADAATARRLRGDLDTIALKALAKEPARRYASADALADDLRRHLDGLTVRACPDTVGYRLGKFVRRHRTGVAMTAVTVVLVAVLSAFYAFRITSERSRAQNEAARSAAVAGFLEQLLRAPNARWYNDAEATGPDTPIRAVLDEAAARIARDFADQPDLRADLHHLIGDTYGALRLWDEATPHHLAALALRESLYTAPHPKLAEALYYAATAVSTQGDLVQEHRLLDRAVAMQRARNEGNNFPFMIQSLVRVHRNAGRPAAAEPLLTEARRFVEDTFVPGHDGERYREGALLELAALQVHTLLDQGHTGRAVPWLAYGDSLLARLPRRAAHHPAWQRQTCARGRLRRLEGRYAAAERALLACTGEGPPRGVASPFPLPEATFAGATLPEASAELVALYEAWGRPDEAAPYHAAAARFVAERDSVRQIYADAERGR